jgi:predicted nucleic acid-binding protein
LKRKAINTHPNEPKKSLLLDSNVYLSYLKDDNLSEHAEHVVDGIQNNEIEPYISSIIFDDIITALRSKQVETAEIKKTLLGIASIGGTPLIVTPTIALTALSTYERHGGLRKLHYFDSFHTATAHHNELPLVTSDKYIIEHQSELSITVFDLRSM